MKILKWIGIGVIQVAIGAILLFLLNAAGGYFDFSIPINPITASITGILGIPGVLALIVIQLFIV